MVVGDEGVAGELGVSPRSTVHAAFGAPELVLAEFHCPAGDPLWSQVNEMGAGHHLVFPGTSVLIDQEGRGRVVADPTQVVSYAPGQRYRRQLVAEAGDHCTYLLVGEDLLAQVAAAHGHRLGPGGLPRPSAPLPPAAHLLQASVTARLARRADADALTVHEALLSALDACVAAALDSPTAPTGAAVTPPVEQVRLLLAARFAERLTLDGVADAVGMSPFHVHRLFRQQTGRTIHRHRDELRLRHALPRVIDGTERLATIAADVGYASHAHLTDRFRRHFGATPSAVRRRARRGDLAELRKILEA